ncbi:HD domain-containing protein [Paenibacillus sp. NPDC058174]|uniref:HD domain-containing protein n=1 Tax=Paenibacillus sp. NPDC058174 TaxID=3346366 RepID=UPI0036DF231C
MNIETAISIALQAHKGQTDKGGVPYILHPLAVMNRVSTMEEKIAAVLHDVVEDSDVTLEQLRQLGFSAEIVDAVRVLTKQEGESYDAFVARAAANPIARMVKIADIQENMDLSRIKEPSAVDHQRVEKYRAALERLRR